MDNNEKTSEKITKWLLVGISVLFLAVMLLLPLITVITEALRSGWKVYAAAVTDEYTIKALLLTVKATLFAVVFNTVFGVFAAWALTKFQFRGKKLLTTLIDLPVTISPVIAGLIFLLIFGRQSPVYFFLMKLGIKVVFSVPGIIIATVFVTFPFISRELIPVLEAEGSDEEEAAAPAQTADNSAAAAAGEVWKCTQTLNTPSGYSGGPVRLELIQNVNGTPTASVVLEDQVIQFPYDLDITGAPGISEGTLYLSEQISGTYQELGNYSITFAKAE